MAARPDPPDFSRRAFLRASGGAAGGALLALHAPALLSVAKAATAAHAAGAAFVNLAPAEAAAFEAIAARIIPTDDTPGAREAGVIHFIDQALGDFMSGAANDLRAGLAVLEALAGDAEEGKRFAELAPDRQDALLREIEQGPFFGLMHYLTVAGMFALPSYGGNRDYTGWKLLGFTHQHVWVPPFGYYDAEAMDRPAPAPDAAGDHGHG
jgi:gluconate 2-dehydrogenase gamma chain